MDFVAILAIALLISLGIAYTRACERLKGDRS